ncbi:MAG: hypothetical protein AB7Q42_22710 [Acidimicrobiia bacterium]
MTTRGAFIRTVIRGGSTAGRRSNEELNCYANVLRQPERARASSACYRTFLTREPAGSGVVIGAGLQSRPSDAAM